MQHLAMQVVSCSKGRGKQMNAGAQRAHGDMLLFLHADSQLPAGYDEAMQSAWCHAASRAPDAPPRCDALRQCGSRIHKMSIPRQQPLLTFDLHPPAGGAALKVSGWAAGPRHCGGGWCIMACGGAREHSGRPTAIRPSSWSVAHSGPHCADAGRRMGGCRRTTA